MSDAVELRQALRQAARARARVFVGTGSATPDTLLSSLASVSMGGTRASVVCGLLRGNVDSFTTSVADGLIDLRVWQLSAATYGLVASSRASYLPLSTSALVKHVLGAPPDLALVRVTPPDRAGFVGCGPSGYSHTIARASKRVIGEVDETLPRTRGRTNLHISEFEMLCESLHPTPVYEERTSTAADVRSVSRNVLSLLPDRPVLQVGVGSVPETMVADMAAAEIDVAAIVGIGTDAMIPIFERMSRRLGPDGRAYLTELLGSEMLMAYADDNPLVEVHGWEEMFQDHARRPSGNPDLLT